MPVKKVNLNTTYISERVSNCLSSISCCALTTVIAPMGYGKTTAIQWYLNRCARTEKARVIRVSIYSDSISILWQSLQNAFAFAGLDVLKGYDRPSDAASAALLTDELYHALAGGQPCYLFLDDLHLLTDARIACFLCHLANRLPENVHIIAAGRDRFLPESEIVRLGSRLHRIEAKQLRLTREELSAYTARCGLSLTDAQADQLIASSEGWFSAIYLQLCALTEQGTFPDRHSNIYQMFTAALIDPLSPENQKFLAVMGLADEFTAEMARAITGRKDTDAVLAMLTAQNAFVTRLPNGQNFRFHHMMKECAGQVFRRLPQSQQNIYQTRYGRWYENHEQYLLALNSYQVSGNYDAALEIIRKDAGIHLAAVKPEEVLAFLDQCPESTLKEHPFSLLVLMRRLFTWRQVPRMMALKKLLEDSILEHPEMSQEEQGNLRGECDLILSFLMYNDISQMSRLHRSASRQMSRPAISIRNEGSWTFGSPSVLMMFHREAGRLQQELSDMNECMPHYYKITSGHGLGAELVMSAEAAAMQGKLSDAEILLEQTRTRIHAGGQMNMTLCCDFLDLRLKLFSDTAGRACVSTDLRHQERDALLRQHNTMWLNIFDASYAYYYAILDQEEDIPPFYREHALNQVNFLAPCRPMMEMIESQVLLTQKTFSRVIGRNEELIRLCRSMHYALVALHLQIQTAASYEQLGKRVSTLGILKEALQDAIPDHLILPFAENYPFLKELLPILAAQEPEESLPALITEIQSLGKQLETQIRTAAGTGKNSPLLASLTEKEAEIARMASERMSNREIAEQLYLSEGTIKQYMNQIYAKLQIHGNSRAKRQQLRALVTPESH